MKKELDVFTDGACKGNPGLGGWGFAVFYCGKNIHNSKGGSSYTTNNKMELLAAIKALCFISENYKEYKVILHTDSFYVKNGIDTWIHNWVRNGWKTAAKKPIKNKELWKQLHKLKEDLELEWKWVKGHYSNPGNELADTLANEGIKYVKRY